MEPGVDWKAKANKWEAGIDTENSTSQDLTDYIQTKTHLYEVERAADSDLWDLYQEEFKDFTVATFKKVGTRPLQLLRNTLRSRGVYIQKNDKHNTLAEVLYNTLQEEEQHQWTEDEIISAISETTLNSHKLQWRLKTMNNLPQAQALITPPDHTPMAPLGPLDQTPMTPLSQNQAEPLFNQPRATNGNGKIVSEIAKIYTEEQKYNGTNGSFDHKLTIFLDIY
jgi:hypothetical protein